jgi:eukaryotic translation initiation factor 2C
MTKAKYTHFVETDVLTIKEAQRYNFKMDEKQTSNMIKFVVTSQRWSSSV